LLGGTVISRHAVFCGTARQLPHLRWRLAERTYRLVPCRVLLRLNWLSLIAAGREMGDAWMRGSPVLRQEQHPDDESTQQARPSQRIETRIKEPEDERQDP
jgi:hypothetical protein